MYEGRDRGSDTSRAAIRGGTRVERSSQGEAKHNTGGRGTKAVIQVEQAGEGGGGS